MLTYLLTYLFRADIFQQLGYEKNTSGNSRVAAQKNCIVEL